MSDVDDESSRDPLRDPKAVRSSWMLVLVVGVVAGVVLGAVALGLSAGDSEAEAPQALCGPTMPKLTVHGTGEATAVPDLLTIVVQVSDTGSSATLALEADDTKAAAVAAAFKDGGVEANDIQTSDLTVQPQYSYPKGIPTVSGYQVVNAITATLHDVTRSGAVIDAVVGAAGNAAQIQSLSFSTRHAAVVEAKARARAATQAVHHARALAQAAGRVLGPVCSLTDQSPSPAERSPSALTYASAAGAPEVPIEAGSQAQLAQVALVFALLPARNSQKPA